MSEKKTVKVELELTQIENPGLVQIQPTDIQEFEVNTNREIAPLVSAECYPGTILLNDVPIAVTMLRVRIMVFVNSADQEPVVGVTDDNTCFYIQTSPPKVPNNVAEGQATYNMYYIHFNRVVEFPLTQITVFNNLSDPKTSRGTVTTVQSTTPPIP